MTAGVHAFGCGHPRTADNSLPYGDRFKDGSRAVRCALCNRVRHIVAKVKRDQARINAGGLAGTLGAKYPLGRRIAADS